VLGQIAGVSTVKEANEPANLLHAGELPARLVVIDTDSSDKEADLRGIFQK
jgi:hypothetical protein